MHQTSENQLYCYSTPVQEKYNLPFMDIDLPEECGLENQGFWSVREGCQHICVLFLLVCGNEKKREGVHKVPHRP